MVKLGEDRHIDLRVDYKNTERFNQGMLCLSKIIKTLHAYMARKVKQALDSVEMGKTKINYLNTVNAFKESGLNRAWLNLPHSVEDGFIDGIFDFVLESVIPSEDYIHGMRGIVKNFKKLIDINNVIDACVPDN